MFVTNIIVHCFAYNRKDFKMRNKKVKVALIVAGIIGFIFSLTLLFGDSKITGGIGLVIYALIIAAGFSKNLGEKVQHNAPEKRPVVKKEKSAIVADPKVITKREKLKKEKVKKEKQKREKVKAAKTKSTISYIKHDSYNGKHLSYEYIADFTPVNLEAVHSLIEDTSLQTNHQFKWELGDGKVKLLYGGEYAGDLYFKFDMFSDYARRGDPVVVYLKKVDDMAGEYEVEIAFFRDKEKQYQYREQTVVALTAYKKEDRQDIISTMEPGDEIEVEYDSEKDKYVAVYGDIIGTFPAKIGERLEEQDPTFVIFDSADETEDGDEIIYKPYVKIYW